MDLTVVAFSSRDFAMAGAWGSSTGHRRRQRESDVEGAAHPEVVNSTSRLLCVRRGIRSVHLRSVIFCRHWITSVIFVNENENENVEKRENNEFVNKNENENEKIENEN